MRFPSRYGGSLNPGRVLNAASMGSMLNDPVLHTEPGAEFRRILYILQVAHRVGRESPSTLSGPIARQQKAAASAESTPPETPTTIPVHPLFQ